VLGVGTKVKLSESARWQYLVSGMADHLVEFGDRTGEIISNIGSDIYEVTWDNNLTYSYHAHELVRVT
jgi:hypothetical protein